MRRLLIAALVGLLMLLGVVQAAAATIHTHFFESIDVDLSDQQFQIMSVAMLSGEELTVVAYGVTGDVVPQVTLLDPLGTTVGEDLNSDANEVAYVQHTVRQAGVFTMLVSRQGTEGGLVRVMVFEGEPLEPNATYLDTLDPFAPSRAFMIATDPEDPFPMSVDLLEPEEDDVVLPEVFASRSDTDKLASEDERTSAIPDEERVSWLNSEELPFYTLNVRPFPEILNETASRIGGFLRPAMQGFEIFDYLIILGDGGEPQRVDRTYCVVNGLEVLGIGPGGQWIVVDPDSEFGISLVPQGELNVDLGSEGCDRVVPMQVHPDLVPVVTTGGGGTTGGLPPAGDPPDPGGDDDDDVTLPTPPPPTGDDDDVPPGFSFSISCVDTGDAVYDFSFSWTNLPNGTGFLYGEFLASAPYILSPASGSGSETQYSGNGSSSWEVRDADNATILGQGTVTCSPYVPPPYFEIYSCEDIGAGAYFTQFFWDGLPNGATLHFGTGPATTRLHGTLTPTPSGTGSDSGIWNGQWVVKDAADVPILSGSYNLSNCVTASA